MTPKSTPSTKTVNTETNVTSAFDGNSVAETIAKAALRLNANQELPAYFRTSGDYASHQFKAGWATRTIIAERKQGDIAAYITHPDAGKKFEELPPAVKNFIGFFSTIQVAIFASLSSAELLELKQAGSDYIEGLKSSSPEEASKTIYVKDPLLTKVNETHHCAWMAARDLAKVLKLDMTIRDHQAHKANSLMTPEEKAADNPQVQAYGVILATVPQEHFDYLLGRAQG